MELDKFKYERLSTFCFVCGLIGHSDRDCGIVYANPDKDIDRAYGVWLRAPTRSMKNQNLGAKWLRTGGEGSRQWSTSGEEKPQSTTAHGKSRMAARFMEVDGRIHEILGENGGIRVVQRNQGDMSKNNNFSNQREDITGGDIGGTEAVIMDPKRRRVDNEENKGSDETNILNGLSNPAGQKTCERRVLCYRPAWKNESHCLELP